MNVLIVMSGGFDTYGPSRHLYDALIEDLLFSGASIHLIESHSSGIDPDAPQKFVDNPNFSFEALKIPVVAKKAFVKRYLTGVKYCKLVKKTLKIKKTENYSIVFMQSCPWAPFMIASIKKYIKAPLIWNIQDMFPGSSIANGVMKNKLMQKFFYAFQKKAYRKSDFITAISDDMKNKIMEQGVEESKIEVIVNWFDDHSVREIPPNENRFIKKYNLNQNLFYVQYAGTMGFNFDYKFVLKVAEMLSPYENICFQMIGFGSQKEDFELATKEKKLLNIQFLPIQPQEMVSDVYSSCNVCLIPLPEGVIGNSVPSKAGLLMACKRPIITSSDKQSLYNKMINDNKIGFAYGTDEPEKVANAILYLFNHKEACIEMGENGFKYGHYIFSRKVNTEKYIELFRKISKEL